MKRKKKLTKTEALAKIATLPVQKVTVTQSRRESGLARFQREEAEREAAEQKRQEEIYFAPVRQAEKQLNETLRKLRDKKSEMLMTVPSEELNTRCKRVTTQFKGKSSEQCMSLIREAFSEFRAALEDSRGVRLETAAIQKLQAISSQNLDLDLSDVETWRQIYDYADELGIFNSHDVTHLQVTEPEPVQEPVPVDALGTIDTLPATREGERQARELAQRHYLTTEASQMFVAWTRHLYNDYAGFIPDESQTRAAIQYFIDHNKSYLNHKSWDECRRYLVAAHIFPSHLLTPDEILASRIEHSDMSARDARIDFARESRRINVERTFSI
jgi:hypothetical protein